MSIDNDNSLRTFLKRYSSHVFVIIKRPTRAAQEWAVFIFLISDRRKSWSVTAKTKDDAIINSIKMCLETIDSIIVPQSSPTLKDILPDETDD